MFHNRPYADYVPYVVFNPPLLRRHVASPILQMRTRVSKEAARSRCCLAELDLKPDLSCSQKLSLAIASRRTLSQIAESRLGSELPNLHYPLPSLVSHCSYERQAGLLWLPVAPRAYLSQAPLPVRSSSCSPPAAGRGGAPLCLSPPYSDVYCPEPTAMLVTREVSGGSASSQSRLLTPSQRSASCPSPWSSQLSAAVPRSC